MRVIKLEKLIGLAAMVFLSATAAASEPVQASPIDRQIMGTDGYLSAHPDLGNRVRALQAIEEGDLKQAHTYLLRAARFADKPSQALLGEQYWQGNALVESDRAVAYVWMDLAAERHYKMFLLKREYYWNRLSEAERQRAYELGDRYYREYGDDVAKPRLERKLRIERSKATGSRVGSAGNLQVTLTGRGGTSVTVDGSHYYQDKFWRAKPYWEWNDYVWDAPSRGEVTVEPLINVDTPKQSPKESEETSDTRDKPSSPDSK